VGAGTTTVMKSFAHIFRREGIRAQVIVLAGGAVGSPALLLRSNMAGLPKRVGEGFTCHPAHILVAEHDQPRSVQDRLDRLRDRNDQLLHVRREGLVLDRDCLHHEPTALSEERAAASEEGLEVLGADGDHVGTVDCLKDSDKIVLTKSDPKSGGKHHIIPVAWVERVDAHVHLNKPARDAMMQWQSAA